MTLLSDWMTVHDDLDRALRTLRRVAPEGRAAKTRSAVRALAAMTEQHMRQEEQVLMPAYRALASTLPANAAPRVFEADHHRIRTLLADLMALDPEGGADEALRELTLLAELAGAFEHHDLREHRWFVPALDEGVPAATRSEWIESFRAEPLPPHAQVVLEPSAPAPAAAGLRGLGLAIARDGDVVAMAASTRAPPGRRGPALLAACTELARQVDAATSIEDRREALLELADRYRLLAIVAAHPPVPSADRPRTEADSE